MLVSEAKSSLYYKVSASKRGSLSDSELANIFLEALICVASKCAPSELIRPFASQNQAILRHLDDGKVIIVPQKPDFTNPKEHLMIDESLSYAVINEAAFLLGGDAIFRQQSEQIIGDYLANESAEAEYINGY